MMHLYAIRPCYAPYREVELILAESDDEALKVAVLDAAKDVADYCYFSPTAVVYRIAAAEKIGEAKATDAPAEWEWARDVPAILEQQEAAAAEALQQALAETEADLRQTASAEAEPS